MNPVQRVLDDELGRLLDRLSGSVPGGCLEATATRHPSLRRRLDEVEAQMATVRTALMEDYGRWRRGLEDLENLWALAAWKSGAAEPSAVEQATEKPASLAAA